MASEEGTLKVRYDGQGSMIKNHQMNAKSVSKSILAIETIYTEAVNESNRIFNSRHTTNVVLSGGFQDGSLWWLLKVFGKEDESQIQFNHKSNFSVVSAAINKAVETLKLISLESAEIIIRETPDGYEVDIDGKNVVLDEIECAVLTNEKIRSALSDLAMPLVDDGIDTLIVENQTSPNDSIKITDTDKENLLIKRKHKHIVDEGEAEGFFYIETLSYNPRSKWKLVSNKDPSISLSATIADSAFLKRVSDNTEKFSKDDLLYVVVNWYKEKSKLTGKVLTVSTIIEVREHVPFENRQRNLL
ncbi:hypothetical protein [uncultured Psychromonas sp.]|uniref:hypothetical protein n=1 Tax=uncultured Psychromonas sp. TaxID=173974 RepID=UPI00261D15DD|nr:hypothetical protein [uncultured Psychromonas sp.]